MSRKTFTKKEVELLSINYYVQSVSDIAITYSEEFKHLFISEKKKGKSIKEIFEQCGFDTEVLGKERMKSASKRWQRTYRVKGFEGLRDTRTENSGRGRKAKECSREENMIRLEAEIQLLRAENELLKKIRAAERRMEK